MTSDIDSPEPVHDRETRGEREIVDLQFNTLREFRQEMAPRLAEDGMFVSTDAPLPRGTRVRFRFLLPEKFVLAHGDATVAWRRTKSTHPEVEPGMALWFDEVEKRSQDIIQELVDIQKTSGDEVFDSRRGAGEVGNFVANEFAGSFVPASNIPGRETESKPEAPKIERPVPDAVASSHDAPQGLSFEARQRQETASETGRGASPAATSGFSAPEPAGGGSDNFEVSLMSDDAESDETPLSQAAGPVPDMSVVLQDAKAKPRQRRLGPFAGLTAVVFAAAAVSVWWFVFRPQSQAVREVHESAEVVQPAAAVVLLDDTDAEEVARPPESDTAPAPEPTEIVEQGPQSPPPAEIAPASRVVDVDAVRSGDATVVSIRGDGGFDDSRLQLSVLPEPPRVLARIARIETYYRPSEIEVGSPELVRVRVGYHPEDNPPKLYVVLDLADDTVVVRESSVSGEMIRIVVGRE